MRSSRSFYRLKVFFVLPALLLYGIFTLYPFLSSLLYSFTNWDGLQSPDYVGLANYQALFHDKAIVQAAKNTLYVLAVMVLIGNPISLILALLLNLPLRSRGLLRTLFFLPALMSLMVISISWGFILQYDGLLNAILTLFGFENGIQDWLGTMDYALPAVILILLWQGTGFGAVIYLAGLQSVPKELQESAQIDGATGLQRIYHITIPLIMPFITINTFLGIAGSLKLFDVPFVLTNGGPGTATTTLGLLIYKYAFVHESYGYATAAGMLFMVLIAAITFLQLSITRRREVEM